MNSVQIHETDSMYLKLPSIQKFLCCLVPQIMNLMKNANSHKFWVSNKLRSPYPINVKSAFCHENLKPRENFLRIITIWKFWVKKFWLSAKNWQIIETSWFIWRHCLQITQWLNIEVFWNIHWFLNELAESLGLFLYKVGEMLNALLHAFDIIPHDPI